MKKIDSILGIILTLIIISSFLSLETNKASGQSNECYNYKGPLICKDSSKCLLGFPLVFGNTSPIPCSDPECNIGPCIKFDQGDDCKCPEGFYYNLDIKLCSYEPAVARPLNIDLQCGCDGRTYSNEIDALSEGVKKYTSGPCNVNKDLPYICASGCKCENGKPDNKCPGLICCNVENSSSSGNPISNTCTELDFTPIITKIETPSSIFRTVKLGDFNKDSFIDLAITTGNKIIEILPGNGKSGFSTSIKLSLPSTIEQFVTNDFNGDSILDIASTSSDSATSSKVLVSIGNGDGSFQAPIELSIEGSLYYLITDDFNNDSKADLIIQKRIQLQDKNKLVILLGRGNGSFVILDKEIDVTNINYLISTDLNNDLKKDIVVSNGETLSVLLGNGRGDFEIRTRHGFSGFGGSLNAGDFNKDSIVDIVTPTATNSQFKNISILIGNGDGTFKEVKEHTLSKDTNSTSTADFNNDSYLDLVLTSSSEVLVLLGKGDGSFKKELSFPYRPKSYLTLETPPANFNRDNKPDLLLFDRIYFDEAIIFLNKDCSPASSSSSSSGTIPSIDNCKCPTGYIWSVVNGVDTCVSKGDRICTTEFDPVCGCDGKTYGNGCEATSFYGVKSFTEGACTSSSSSGCLNPCGDKCCATNQLCSVSDDFINGVATHTCSGGSSSSSGGVACIPCSDSNECGFGNYCNVNPNSTSYHCCVSNPLSCSKGCTNSSQCPTGQACDTSNCCQPCSYNSSSGSSGNSTFIDDSIVIDDRRRTFHIHVPPQYLDGTSVPLVLVFHGGDQPGKNVAEYTKFNEKADAEGFIAVYPDGVKLSWNDGRGTTDAEKLGVDDIKFVSRLVSHLKQDYSIDSNRIYATGISNGGTFSERIGCELADTFAAIAPVVGPIPTNLVSPPEGVSVLPCNPSNPISYLGIQGTSDLFIPINGGIVGYGNGLGEGGLVESAENTLNLWATKNRCPQEPTTIDFIPLVDDGTSVKGTSYNNCENNTGVDFYTIDNGGHTWPPEEANQCSQLSLGISSKNINATDTIWDFFKSHPKNVSSEETITLGNDFTGIWKSRGITLKLCIKNGILEGIVKLPGIFKKGQIISQTVISPNEVQVTVQGRNGEAKNLTLTLPTSNRLTITLEDGSEIETIKVATPKSCPKVNNSRLGHR